MASGTMTAAEIARQVGCSASTLYRHVPGGRAAVAESGMSVASSLDCMFGMLSVLSEFERSMIRDRVMAGLDRARSSDKRLCMPRMAPFKIDRIRAALDEGRGVRETARLLKVSAAKVSEVRRMSATTGRSAPLIDHAKTDDQAQFQGDTCKAATIDLHL